MQIDLFDKMTKEEMLAEWCKGKGFFSKADIMRYGLDNFYLRADRTIREWVAEGKVRHIPSDECIFRNLKGRMAYYEWRG